MHVRWRRQQLALFLPAGLCILLYLIRVIHTRDWTDWFLIENLSLAYLPLGFSALLVKNLKRWPWFSLPNLALSALWLIFLPNAWYVLTDYVHTSPTGQINQLYDIVFVTSLVIAGFIAGFTSLRMVHKELLKRLEFKTCTAVIALILFISSFAIYVGRDLRWSSWDVVSNPGGIALDVSDRVIHPLGHPSSWNMTGSVFLLLVTLYASLWLWLESAKQKRN